MSPGNDYSARSRGLGEGPLPDSGSGKLWVGQRAKAHIRRSRDYLRLISPHPLTVLFSGDAMRSSLAWGKNETTRVHHILRGRCGRVAALLARATDSLASSRVYPRWVGGGFQELRGRFPQGSQRNWLLRRSKSDGRVPLGA